MIKADGIIISLFFFKRESLISLAYNTGSSYKNFSLSLSHVLSVKHEEKCFGWYCSTKQLKNLQKIRSKWTLLILIVVLWPTRQK